jgi:hypothetical protein
VKKLLSLLVLGVITWGLAGCSGSEQGAKPVEDKSKQAPGVPKDGV